MGVLDDSDPGPETPDRENTMFAVELVPELLLVPPVVGAVDTGEGGDAGFEVEGGNAVVGVEGGDASVDVEDGGTAFDVEGGAAAVVEGEGEVDEGGLVIDEGLEIGSGAS
jgi:hypothetical protein